MYFLFLQLYYIPVYLKLLNMPVNFLSSRSKNLLAVQYSACRIPAFSFPPEEIKKAQQEEKSEGILKESP